MLEVRVTKRIFLALRPVSRHTESGGFSALTSALKSLSLMWAWRPRTCAIAGAGKVFCFVIVVESLSWS